MVIRNVGVLGLGNIGSSIAKLLAQSGFIVHGYDPREEARLRLTDDGGESHESAISVVGESEVIITSLPSAVALTQVLEETVTLLAGKVLIETSTLDLQSKMMAYKIVTSAGGQIVDSPLSGTAMQAAKGDVVAYASADEGVIDQVIDVLDGFNRRTYRLGSYGTGSKMKYIANLLVAVHNVSTAEALVLAKRAGLDLDEAIEVIADGAGGSRMLEVRGPMMAAGTYGAPGMNVGVFMKDIAVISSYARDLGVPTPLLSASTPIYAAAVAHGWSNSDTASVYAILSDMANLKRDKLPEEKGSS